MRVIDRILEYLQYHQINPHLFEKTCGIANGYLKKQAKGKGSVGSEILDKITRSYQDLSLEWIITGKGNMVTGPYPEARDPAKMLEEESLYPAEPVVVKLLREKIDVMEHALADKEKIIRLLEQRPP